MARKGVRDNLKSKFERELEEYRERCLSGSDTTMEFRYATEQENEDALEPEYLGD